MNATDDTNDILRDIRDEMKAMRADAGTRREEVGAIRGDVREVSAQLERIERQVVAGIHLSTEIVGMISVLSDGRRLDDHERRLSALEKKT